MFRIVLGIGIMAAFLAAYQYAGWVGVVCVLVILILCGLALFRWQLKGGEETTPRELPTSTEEACAKARLVAWGHRKPLSMLADVSGDPFEPVIVEVTMRRERPFYLFLAIIAVTVVVRLPMAPRGLYETPIALCLVPIALWAMARYRPTYYRIVPGRMDILVGSLFGRVVKLTKRIDLRVAKVTLEGKKRYVEIELPGEAAMDFYFDKLSEPMPFVRAVFRGALCTSPAPPLPDDALLG